MVRAAISFFILALVAYFLGANGIAGLSLEIGYVLLWVFLGMAALSCVASFVTGRKPTQLL